MSRPASGRGPILVTGAHRSGTTWVGKMLAAAPGVGYVREPFNPHCRPGVSGLPIRYWFTYVTDENAAPFVRPLEDILAFRYGLLREVRAVRAPRDAARMARDWAAWLLARARRARPLLKDPIAVFSAEWLARAFAMDVVVVVRHPAAFAASLKRLGWSHPFSHFIAQPLLLRDHLGPFEEEIRAHAAREQPIVDQAALLWRMIYGVIETVRARHPGWIVVRHEDLSRDPVLRFRSLYARLGLPLTPRARRAIEAHSAPSNPAGAPEGASAWRLDSRANVAAWKRRLSPEEIARLRASVGGAARAYYGDEEW